MESPNFRAADTQEGMATPFDVDAWPRGPPLASQSHQAPPLARVEVGGMAPPIGSDAWLGGPPLPSQSHQTFPAGGRQGGVATPFGTDVWSGGVRLVHGVTKLPVGW